MSDFTEGLLLGVAWSSAAWILFCRYLDMKAHREWMSLADRFEDELLRKLPEELR